MLRILLFSVIIFLLVEFEKAFGPALVRPYVMPFIRKVNKALGCGARRDNSKLVLFNADAIQRTVSHSEKSARILISNPQHSGKDEVISTHAARAASSVRLMKLQSKNGETNSKPSNVEDNHSEIEKNDSTVISNESITINVQ